jgi:hypothetical protein
MWCSPDFLHVCGKFLPFQQAIWQILATCPSIPPPMAMRDSMRADFFAAACVLQRSQ